MNRVLTAMYVLRINLGNEKDFFNVLSYISP